MFNFQDEVLAAQQRIAPYIRVTPLDFSPPLSKITQAQVYLKCEHLQYTGAFKVRGAFNKLLTLSPSQRQQGVVTASSGNHGAAVARGLTTFEIPGLVFVPQNVAPTKLENIKNYNVPLELYGTDCVQTEQYALDYATHHNKTYISPYNDLAVIAGQGTIALELHKQLNQIDIIIVPIGGGGLISGIAGYIKAVSPKTKIIGCMPENSPVMAESIKAGKIITMETLPTYSDATAGGIEPDAITFEMCQAYVDDTILVSEEEIAKAILCFIKTQHQLIEGAAGVALAALFKNAEQFKNKNVVVILSGANISLSTLKEIVNS